MQTLQQVLKQMPKGWMLDKCLTGNGIIDFDMLADYQAMMRADQREMVVAAAYLPQKYNPGDEQASVKLYATRDRFEIRSFGEDQRSPVERVQVEFDTTEKAIFWWIQNIKLVAAKV